MLKRLLSLFKKPTQAIDAEEPDFGEEDWGSDLGAALFDQAVHERLQVPCGSLASSATARKSLPE
ncbi:MAG: hypothetical protein GY847_42265 [Proteobacteria bacterium]|nr:hypothetical protein [Pseudomonadota bacterium]